MSPRLVLPFTAASAAALVALFAARAFVPSGPAPAYAHPSPPPTSAPATHTDGAVNLSLSVDQSVVHVSDLDGVAVVEVRGEEQPDAPRTPVSIALVIDTSGSMSGLKIAQARSAARALVEQLASGDVVSVVSYGTSARALVSAVEIGNDRSDVFRAIDGLSTNGSTCLSCGLEVGYQMVQEAPASYARRVVVLSDGRVNGGVSTVGGLRNLAGAAAEDGAVTSTIGFGSDFDEQVMTAVAVAAAGGYYFLPEGGDMAEILDREFRAVQALVATNVELTVSGTGGAEIDAGHIPGAVASGNGARIVLRQLAAGEVRRFVVRVRYHEGETGALRAGLTYTGRDERGHTLSDAVVAIERTHDTAFALSSVDAEAAGEAEMLEALQVADRAMVRMREGDVEEAAEMLGAVRSRLDARSAELGDGRLADEARNIDALQSAIEADGFDAYGEAGRGLMLQNAARASEASSGVAREQMYHSGTTY